jgi:hypothetical protein
LKHFYFMKIKGGTGVPAVLDGLWPDGKFDNRACGTGFASGGSFVPSDNSRRHRAGRPLRTVGTTVPPVPEGGPYRSVTVDNGNVFGLPEAIALVNNI